MKFLTDRKEIARKINVEKVPVVTVELDKPLKDYPDCYEGGKINVLGGHSARYADLETHCEVRMYSDEVGNECHGTPWMYKKIILQSFGTFLTSSFGLSDVDRMVEWSNARTVKAEDEVIIYFISRQYEMGFLRLMKVGKHIDPHCSTVATLEDIDE